MPDTVDIVLSNPLTNRYGPRLGLVPTSDNPDETLAGVGDTVTVVPSAAMSLIAAGYAQVDPEDRRAVAKALGTEDVPPVPVSGDLPVGSSDPYDPGAHTVDDVQKYLSSASDDEKERVIAAERACKDRYSITG